MSGAGPPPRQGLSRRALLRLGAAGLAAGVVGTAAVLALDDEASETVRVRSVRDYGARGDGGDATDALRAALGSGASVVHVPRGEYRVSAGLDVPWSVRGIVLEEGAVLRQTVDEILLRRRGRVEPEPRTVREAEEGATFFRLEDLSGLARGSWVYLASDDWIKEGKSRYGMLRRVVRLQGDQVHVDRPLIRTLATRPRAHGVRMAPSLQVRGGGVLEHEAPEHTFANLVRLDFVDRPVVRGPELRRCGGAALRTFGTVGGVIQAYIHDCVDDEEGGHFGYGVSCSSATRGLRVLGRMHDVRHAVTTDHGWGALVDSLHQTGEPEQLLFAPKVARTSSTGIDTHEPGYGIDIVPDVSGCGTARWGGINIRCRGVTIRDGTVRDSNEWGLMVQPGAADVQVRDVTFDGVRGSKMLHCKGPAAFAGVEVRGFEAGFGAVVDPGVQVRTNQMLVDGGDAPGTVGLALRGSDGDLSGSIRRCGTGLLLLPEARGNDIDLRYRDCRQNVVTKTEGA